MSFPINMHLKDLKKKNPSELLKIAEELKIENAGTLRKQDMIFAILKQRQKTIQLYMVKVC